jgi:hypothetical protein
VSGTVAGASSQPITITFDASAVAQPGIYHAQLRIKEDTPYSVDNVPVTMTVTAPPDWGKLTGVVSTTGHCDNQPAPLEGVDVLIQGASGTYTATTDANGSYAWWLAEGSYTVTVAAAGHISQTTSVNVAAQVTTTQNFALRVLQPCPQASPDALSATLHVNEMATHTLTLFDHGALSYTFVIQEHLSNAAPTYTVADSGSPDGPIYNWVEISATAPASLTLGDDATAGPFSIGFDFPFYGTDYNQFYVSSNGFISFDALSSAYYANQCPLPNTSAPNNLIALMWDDLNPSATADPLYYQSFSTCPYGGQGACLIVEYSGYHHYGGAVAGTFQAILFDYGSILIQFKDAGDEQGSGSTTGIENADGTQGISYVCNETKLDSNLAVCFAAPGASADCMSPDVPWLSETPITGTVAADSNIPISVTFDATGLSAGVYTATLVVGTSDPVSPSISIPVTLTVQEFNQIYLPLVVKNMHP